MLSKMDVIHETNFVCFGIQHIMELESSEPSHNFIYVDEAGFWPKVEDVVEMSSATEQLLICQANREEISVCAHCAAISENGMLTHIHHIGPYNIQVTNLETLYMTLIPDDERGPFRDDLPKYYVVIWDNVRFHHSHTIRQWFATYYRMLMEFLAPYSPFLNPIEEFSSAWRWKVYERQPHTLMTLLAAMDVACEEDITVDACRGWIRHSKIFFPRCLAREDICCDVDENLWPDRLARQQVYTDCTAIPHTVLHAKAKVLPKWCFLCLPF